MVQLFGRTVILQLNNESFTDFRVNFRITKTVDRSPNEAKIQLYGIGRESTANLLFSGRETRVRLLAGYDGSPSLLFEGHPIKDGVALAKDGPERVLEIQAQDGVLRYQRARVNVAYERSTTYGELVQTVVRQMGLPEGIIDRSMPDWDRAVEGATVLEGRASDVMDRLAESLKSQWSIQDGKLQFIPEGRSRLNRGPRFSPELRNVVGAPKPREKGGIEINALLYPIVPGDRFVVDGFEDPRFRGIYRADSVVHTGDTGYDAAFYTNIQGRKIPG
jgi:hypothetical protein